MKLPPLSIFGIPITQGSFESGPSIQSNTILDWSGMGPIWQKWESDKLSLNLACLVIKLSIMLENLQKPSMKMLKTREGQIKWKKKYCKIICVCSIIFK